MIVEHPPETSGLAAKGRVLWRSAALFTVFFGLTIILQVLSGAYRSEFAGYPDESAHYVTGLMVRDFVAGLNYGSPMEFAEDYYSHYPKVALGHWPPLFYILEAGWMLIFSTSRASILVGLAVLTSLLAFTMYAVVKRHFGLAAGVLGGLLLVCLPIIQVFSDEVMAESLLTLTSFLAVLSFGRYLSSERWQDSGLFGFLASLAILTKGSGWDLAIVPPVALVLTRKFELLKKWTFWLPAVVVAMLCGPWQLMTMQMAQRGWTGGEQPSISYTLGALREFLPMLVNLLGWGLAPLVLIGIVVTVVIPYFRGAVQAEWASLFGLILAAWLFHSIVPAGVEQRKLVIAVPALILFLFAGGNWLAERLRGKRAVVAIAAIAIFGIQKFSIPREIHYGYIEAARFIRSNPDLHNLTILVSSDSDGEGMLISELAMDDKRPAHTIFRGTKKLALTNWQGQILDCYYQTPEQLLAYLEQANVGLLVSDVLPPMISQPQQRVVQAALEKYPDRLKLMAKFTGDVRGSVNVYRVN